MSPHSTLVLLSFLKCLLGGWDGPGRPLEDGITFLLTGLIWCFLRPFLRDFLPQCWFQTFCPHPWDPHTRQTKGIAFGSAGGNDSNVYIALAMNEAVLKPLHTLAHSSQDCEVGTFMKSSCNLPKLTCTASKWLSWNLNPGTWLQSSWTLCSATTHSKSKVRGTDSC